MYLCANSGLTVLFLLCGYATALPAFKVSPVTPPLAPVSLVPPSLVTLPSQGTSNATTRSANHTSDSHPLGYNPPPSEPFSYHVPDSNIDVIFIDYSSYPSRNESLVSSCITAAIRATSSHEYLQLIHTHDLSYLQEFADGSTYHKNAFAIFPEDAMTWGMWTTALIGIDWFIGRYEGWDFMFEVFLVDEVVERRSRQLLGEGYMWTLDELPPVQ